MTDDENQMTDSLKSNSFSKKDERNIVVRRNKPSHSSAPNDWCPAEGPHPSD